MTDNKQRTTDQPMLIALRPAFADDFDYCRRLYFAEEEWLMEELNLDRAALAATLQQKWGPAQVRIITLDGSDVGWVQSFTQEGELFIGEIVIDGPFQRKGIGTEVINRLIGEAARLNQAVRLSVAKINPALRLYERLGFEVTHKDDRKYYMKRDATG